MRVTANTEIRSAIRDAGLRLWEVADCYGVTDSNFYRLLRHELTGEKRERVLAAIEKAKENKRS